MSRSGWWIALAGIPLGVLALDLATGPFIQFPILFVIPAGLVAWRLGRVAGLAFAPVLVALRV
jgi:hypothetical protein